jgi:hypothetical protein
MYDYGDERYALVPVVMLKLFRHNSNALYAQIAGCRLWAGSKSALHFVQTHDVNFLSSNQAAPGCVN